MARCARRSVNRSPCASISQNFRCHYTSPVESSRRDLWLIPALVVLAHAVVLGGYGWFRDEFYYLQCAAHLDYGYVDHPALSILPLWLVRATVGDSLIIMRLLAAVTMGAAVWVIGRLVHEFGGAGFARVVAMTCAAIAPVYLALGSYYSMNALDVLFWALAAWRLIRAMRSTSLRDWIILGVVLGLGLNNKISVLWLIGGIGLGIVLADIRQLRSRGPWVAAAIVAVFAAPYLAWQARHDWSTLEFIQQASAGKMLVQAPDDFFWAQVLNMHPAALPVWLAGLWVLLVRPPAPSARVLGLMFVSVCGVLLANATSRASYLAPAFAPLLAAGACWWESWLTNTAGRVRAAVIAGLVCLGAAVAPLAMPVLSPEVYTWYAAALGHAPGTDERNAVGALPQFFADRFGWTEWTSEVVRVYRSLPAAEQAQATIFASNYGEAAALDTLGRAAGLPPVRSGHNNYWWWGPGDRAGTVIALVPSDGRANLEALFESVEVAGTIRCEYCMPYENNRPVFVCREPRRPLADLWAGLRHYD